MPDVTGMGILHTKDTPPLLGSKGADQERLKRQGKMLIKSLSIKNPFPLKGCAGPVYIVDESVSGRGVGSEIVGS